MDGLPILQHILKDTTRAYQALQAFRLGAAILISIVLVKLTFTTSEIGDFEWFLFLTNAASFFWSMGLLNAFKSYAPALEDKVEAALVSNLGYVFLLFGIASVAVISCTDYGAELQQQGSWLYFCAFLIFGITGSISEHLLILKDESKSVFYYGLVSYLSYFVGVALIAYIYHTIFALVVFLAFWACIRFLYTLLLVHRYGNWSFDLALMYRFVAYSAPLIVHVLLGGGMEYIDGYLVDTYYSRDEFTIFRYGARELPINTIFITAMVSTMIPLAVTNLQGTMSDLKLRLTRLMHWLFPCSIVLLIASPTIFKLVYNDGFLKSAFVFNIYLLILCSRIVLPQIILYARQKTKVLMWVGLLELIINIALSLYLIQDYGILGVASATVVAYLIQKLVLVWYCKMKLNVEITSYLDVKVHLWYSLLLYVVFFITYYMY